MSALSEGQTLAARFALQRRLAMGGMAEIWIARDSERGAPVVLKVLSEKLAGSPAMIELLRHEYENAERLSHPSIVKVHGIHSDGSRHFIAMELVEGGDFRKFLRGDYREFLPKLLPVVGALSYLHEHGLVHRDVKLSNILLDANGKAKLTDFGIAAVVGGNGSEAALRSGGSLYSMSPQQLEREPPTPSDDIYALGVLLYELLTGRPPFHPNVTPERVKSERPAALGEDVPQGLRDLVLEMLAKAPSERPSSMAEVETRLEELALIEGDATIPPELVGGASRQAEPFERIAPVSPRLWQAHDQPAARTEPRGWLGPALAGVFLLLILSAIAVFVYLPGTVEAPRVELAQRPERAAAVPESGPAVPGLAPLELAQLARERRDVETIVEALLEAQHQLELKHVRSWAPAEFEAASQRAMAGDEAFKRQDFRGAKDGYGEALAAMEVLLERSKTVLSDAIAAGWAAYDERDGERAAERFRFALQVDAEDEEAERGLARAENLDEVLALIEQGRQHESRGALEPALSAYRRASQLDPEITEARAGIERVNAVVGRSRFDEAMSEGFAALERRDFGAARRAFESARSLRPASQAPLDALAQVESAARLAQITVYRQDARQLEARERWAEAAETYSAALELDSTLLFAQEGATRTRDMARLHEELDGYLNEPGRLASATVYQGAASLLDQALAKPNKGPKLVRKLAALQQVLQVANTPVRVRLESDNLTDVVVQQVDSLGRFTVHELELRPGTYTAVGSRDGYRDVRREFTVIAGEPLPPIVIRCEERI